MAGRDEDWEALATVVNFLDMIKRSKQPRPAMTGNVDGICVGSMTVGLAFLGPVALAMRKLSWTAERVGPRNWLMSTPENAHKEAVLLVEDAKTGTVEAILVHAAP